MSDDKPKEGTPQQQTISVEIMAQLLNLTPRHVQRLASQGHIPKAGRGRYELVPTVQAYCKYLQELVAARGNNELVSEQQRLARERADKIARENQVARGELIPRQDVVAGIQEAMAHCRARLLSIPTKAAPLLSPLSRPIEIKEKLTELVHDCLQELSRTRGVPLFEDAGRAGDGGIHHRGAESLGAATQTDGERVG